MIGSSKHNGIKKYVTICDYCNSPFIKDGNTFHTCKKYLNKSATKEGWEVNKFRVLCNTCHKYDTEDNLHLDMSREYKQPMTIKDLKKRLNITDSHIAEMFGYKNLASYANSGNGKKKIEEGMLNMYAHMRKEGWRKIDVYEE